MLTDGRSRVLLPSVTTCRKLYLSELCRLIARSDRATLLVDRQKRIERDFSEVTWVVKASVAIQREDLLHLVVGQLEVE